MTKNNFRTVEGLYAFWSYDTAPFFLGSRIDAIDDEGRVRAPSYGNSWFYPVRILPAEAGEKIHSRLKAAEEKYTETISKAETALRLDIAIALNLGAGT